MKECIVCKKSVVRDLVRNGLPMMECVTCGLVWRRDFDVEISHYEGDAIKLTDVNLNRRIRNVQGRIKLLEKYIVPNNLCDIGAGEGLFLRELNRKGYQNLIGIEPNKEAVSFARSQGLNIVEGTVSDAPATIQKYGLHIVTLFHVIEHLDNPREVLSQIYKSLKDGDYLVIETPNAQGYSFVTTKHRHPLVYPQHLFYFDTHNLKMLLEDVGFKVRANGKRGFDQYNMSIRHALFCLGIGKPTFTQTQGQNSSGINDDEKNEFVDSYPRTILRRFLNAVVVMLGRVDYQWVIAEK